MPNTYTEQSETIKAPIITVYQPKRLVYLAGPVEIEDTWRERASKALIKMGLEPLNPLRNEVCKKVGKHIEATVTDSSIVDRIPNSLIVTRDLHDLHRCLMSGGFCLMNLSTTAEGRKPIGTLLELQWCWDNRLPVVAVMGKDCAPEYRNHPWIKTYVSFEATSVRDALELIEGYFV